MTIRLSGGTYLNDHLVSLVGAGEGNGTAMFASERSVVARVKGSCGSVGNCQGAVFCFGFDFLFCFEVGLIGFIKCSCRASKNASRGARVACEDLGETKGRRSSICVQSQNADFLKLRIKRHDIETIDEKNGGNTYLKFESIRLK